MIPAPADLTYLIEVADTLNLSRAAERIGISQPSLSLAMQRLENAVGAPLLHRSQRGVRLTQAGRQLLASSREMLQLWDTVRSRTLASVSEVTGQYTIGAHPSVAIYALPLAVAKLMSRFPQLEIRLQHDLSRRILEQVVQMRIDIGVVVNPSPHPDLVLRPLCEDKVTLWRSRSDANTSIFIYDPDLLQAQSIVSRLKRSDFKFQRTIHSSSLEVIAQLTRSGVGVGVLPTRVARQIGGLVAVPSAPVFYDKVVLAYRVEQKSVASIQAIADLITSEMRRSD